MPSRASRKKSSKTKPQNIGNAVNYLLVSLNRRANAMTRTLQEQYKKLFDEHLMLIRAFEEARADAAFNIPDILEATGPSGTVYRMYAGRAHAAPIAGDAADPAPTVDPTNLETRK